MKAGSARHAEATVCQVFLLYWWGCVYFSFESPTNSHEILANESTLNQSISDNDPELNNLETELPRLEDVIPAENLKRLKPKEKKRQEVINGGC